MAFTKHCGIAALAALALMLLPLASTARAQGIADPAPSPVLKPEDFARDPYMSPPQVSPDGKAIAWVEDNQVIVHDLADNTDKVQDGGNNQLYSLEWAGNNYLIVYLKDDEVAKSYYVKRVNHSPIVVTRDARYVRLLFEPDGSQFNMAAFWPIVTYIDAPSPYAVTMKDDYSGNIDLATGKRSAGERLMKGDYHYFDHQGREHVAAEALDAKVSYGMTEVVFHYRPQAGADQKTLHLPKKDNTYYINFHYSEFDNSIYWSEFNYTNGLCSIYRYDIATGQTSLYRTGPNKEMNLAFDKAGHIVGITTVTDRIHTEWTDPYYLKMISAVESLFPDSFVEIADMTEDRQNIVFLISAPEAPSSYYYYSAKTKDLQRIGSEFPELDGQTLAPMSYITYKARDGLDIPAYVTKRRDTPPGAPLVVLPHGGPASRDIYDFDYQAQYFASKGYVVLQPQYRGSAGFGDAFQRAGNGHLDQMTTDLEDGVRYLQAQGTINPAKVCVVGWSWGGYLAQAALAFTPQTYVCGISGDGISNLFQSLEDDNDIWWGGYSYEYWRGIIGRDSAAIHATSPIEHVDSIRAPLLLIHGALDFNVSVYQSQRMNKAMKAAGKDVTYIEVQGMQHGPSKAKDRLMILQAMDAFIAKAFGS